MIFYPSFKDQAAELQKSFENMPEAAVQLFGGSTDFFSPVGFLNSQIFVMTLPLLLGILAINLGTSLLGREEQSATIEHLLSRPISRTKLLIAKALAGLGILTLIAGIGAATTIITAHLVDLDVSSFYILQAFFVCYLFALSLGALTYMLTATGRARGASIGIAALVGIGGYLISSLAGTVDWLELPAKLVPFHYYESEAILRHNYEWIKTTFFIGWITLCAGLSWLSFRNRDLG